MSKITLRKKILLLTILALVFEISVFSFLALHAVNQSTDTMLEERLAIAQVVADHIDNSLEMALVELNNFINTAPNIENIDSITADLAHLKDSYLILSYNVSGVILVKGSENIIWSDIDPTLLGEDAEQQASYIGEIIENSNQGISTLLSSQLSSKPMILISTSNDIDEQQDRLKLMLIIDPSLSSIGYFVQPLRLGESGYIEIVDQNGIVLTRTDPGPEVTPFEKSDHSLRFAALIEAGEPTRGLCHTCHEPLMRVETRDVLAFVPMKQARWGVVIRQSEEEALAPIRELRLNLMYYATGTSVIILIGAGLVTSNVVNRIRNLTSASKRISNGDLSTPIPSSQYDEISILADTLESMRLKLGNSYSDLERRTKELALLISISDILSHLSDRKQLNKQLRVVLDKAMEVIGVGSSSVLLFNGNHKKITDRISRGQFTSSVGLLDENSLSEYMEKRNSIIIYNGDKDNLNSIRPDLVPQNGIKAFIAAPLVTTEAIWGILIFGSSINESFSTENQEFVESVARLIAVAVENSSLHQEVQEKERARGDLLRDIFTVQEEQRVRIARELHDETSQVVSSISANIEAALSTLNDDPEKVEKLLRKVLSQSSTILEEIHNIIYELRPTLLDDMGLGPAIRWLIDNNLEPAGIKTSYKITGQQRRLSMNIETTAFRIIQEAINNVNRHSKANKAVISLSFLKKSLRIIVRDNGIGFNIHEILNDSTRNRGLGLLGMEERIELIQGNIIINSRPGNGTEVRVDIPLKIRSKGDDHGKS